MQETLTDGTILLADRAYDSNKLRKTLAARGAWANVKPMPHRLDPSEFSKRFYRERKIRRDLTVFNVSDLSADSDRFHSCRCRGLSHLFGG